MDFEAIVRNNYPQFKIKSFERVLGGWASDTFEVNGKYIFRFPRLAPSKSRLRKELRLLPTLAQTLNFKVPDFEFVNEDVPYVGYKKIGGIPISKCDLDSDELANDIAQCILQIHGFPRKRALEKSVQEIDWYRNYTNFYEKIQNECFHYLDETVQKNASALFESFLGEKENFTFGPKFIHQDLSAEAHILCDSKTNRVVGIIDWEDACIGDPAIDFTGILWDCGEKFAERVIQHYRSLGGTLDGTFRDRNRFYRNIGSFHEILYGLEIKSSEQIMKGVAKVTAEFSEAI